MEHGSPAWDDLDRISARIRGWSTRFTQLAPGPGRGVAVERTLSSTLIVNVQVDTTVALEAQPVARRIAELLHVGILSSPSRCSLWEGHPVGSDVLMFKLGGGLSRFALPPGCEFVVARLDPARVESVFQRLRGGLDTLPGHGPKLYPQPAQKVASLRAHLQALMDQESAAVALVEEALYERVAFMLASPAELVPLAPETRRRVLDRAEEYVHAHARERISLSDLCAAAGCSERTLRTAFRECYGTSPTALLKKLRLQALRRELRDATPKSSTVLDLALRWGFWHMGHLGRDYRRLFGETPSETLAGTIGRGGSSRSTHGVLLGAPKPVYEEEHKGHPTS